MFDLGSSKQFMVYGEFSQLTVRIEKANGDTKHDMTELIFLGQLKLPYAERYQETIHRGKDKVSTKWRRGYHQFDYKGAAVTFEESEDQKFTRVLIQHRNEFKPPCVENWVSEALRFVTAKRFHPRMVIRHFDNDALVFIRETYSDATTGILSPFHGKFHIEKDAWEGFGAYLSKCEENNTWEFMRISDSFSELMAASTGTVQGLLISLCTYIEGVIEELYRDRVKGIEDCITSDKLSELQSYVKEWKDYPIVENRIRGLLSMLTKPPTQTYLRDLVERKVIKPVHQNVWNEVRQYLMHGGLVDRSKSNDFWHYSNHLICMAHRLTLSFIGYQGRVLYYDDVAGYGLEEFKWDPIHENEDPNVNNPSQQTE